jgi:phosphoribosylformimino-5-aminoimidazole carboxamide ribotide isomerase
MLILPAIDLYEGRAVRLLHGDYDKMTVYSEEPVEVARAFKKSGAEYIHLVDLEGARYGTTPNIGTVERIVKEVGLFCEIGGGIRDIETVRAYLEKGVGRVILGTAAVKDEAFLKKAVEKYGDKIAVGIDIKDGYVAIKGWTEKSAYTADEFFLKMEELGVKYVICTDISKDGAMQGTNRELYKELSKKYSMCITASGGVSSADDIRALKKTELYAAIVGKAYYTGALTIEDALEAAK